MRGVILMCGPLQRFLIIKFFQVFPFSLQNTVVEAVSDHYSLQPKNFSHVLNVILVDSETGEGESEYDLYYGITERRFYYNRQKQVELLKTVSSRAAFKLEVKKPLATPAYLQEGSINEMFHFLQGNFL